KGGAPSSFGVGWRRERNPRAGKMLALRREEGVGDAGDLEHFGEVVDADDVGAEEDAGGDGGGGAPEALVGRGGLAVGRAPFLCQGKCRADETFARGADQ